MTASKKLVRFPSEKSLKLVHPSLRRCSYTESERQNAWFNSGEFQIIREDIGKAIRRSSSFKMPVTMPPSLYSNDDKNNGLDQTNLNSWTLNCSAFRGLESIVNPRDGRRWKAEKKRCRQFLQSSSSIVL